MQRSYTRRAAIALAASGALGVKALGTGPAFADSPPATPGGPWVEDAQNVSLRRLHSYAELTDALERLDGRGTALAVRSIGKTNEGRDVWYAETGTGPTRVLYITQQHGNEPLGTEAALQLVQNVAISDSAWATSMRRTVTLGVVVRANPDGGERFWRHNFEPGCSDDFCTPGQGFDINRYHDPAMSPEANPVPEAAAIQRLFRADPYHVAIDYHHQGSYVDEDGDLITTSIFWPNSSLVPADSVLRSKQVAVVTYDALEKYGFAEVSQYPGGTNPGIARNSFGIQGAASLLVELRGDIGQKSSGYLVRSAYAAMASVLDAAGTGALAGVDGSRADAIPLRGDGIDDE